MTVREKIFEIWGLGIGNWGLGIGDWDRGHLALTLASPLGEEGHAVAKGLVGKSSNGVKRQ